MSLTVESPQVEEWVVDDDDRPRRRARWIPVVLAAALLFSAGSAGTWAAFTASTDNASTFATGSLVLSNTKTSGTACLSSGSGGGLTTNSNDCDQLFGVAVQKPGDEASATITLENVGSLDATALKVHAAGACADSDVGSHSGTGSLCSTLRLSIQEYSDVGFSTPSACLYGGGDATTCTFADGTKTVAGFVTAHGDWSAGKSMGTMAAAAKRYVKVSVKLDSGAGNTVQGRQAAFGLTWRIEA